MEKRMPVQQLVNDWKDRGESLQVPNASTRIWREGSGEPVVCLHGVPASGFIYRKVLPALAARGMQGVTFDFPGLGFADRPEQFDYSWSGLSSWTVDALDAAKIDGFHLVVHDIGGPVGFDVMRRIPKRIRSLTVLNTIVRVASFQRPFVMEPFAHRGFGWLWLQGLRTPMIIALMRTVGMHDGPSNDEIRAYGALLMREDGGRAFLKIMRSFERTEQFENGIVTALKTMTVPAQVIWGAQDTALAMKKYAPPVCEVLGLPDWHKVRGKHFLQEDSPNEIAEHIANLVATTI
jgi:haloalkane dehalogenase